MAKKKLSDWELAELRRKEYSKTLPKLKFKFEKLVIDPILSLMKEHQIYLTQPENLPQLAKLGYMYNTLWYAGRQCWGSEGLLQANKKAYDCEDNPKYKIEAVEPQTEEIENLVYDAWGMHVSEMEDGRYGKLPISGDDFIKLIKEGKELTPFELKLRKPNKTFDEWVEVLTDKQYRYSSIYKTRRAVADHLLCCIGNGYRINKEGFIISKASGADQDKDLYGAWENVVFKAEIAKEVDKILSYPEVKLTLDTIRDYCAQKSEFEKKEKETERAGFKQMILESIKKLNKKERKDNPIIISDNPDSEELNELMDEVIEAMYSTKTGKKQEPKKEQYHPYCPISNYSIIHKIQNAEKNQKIEPSTLKACIEICEEILAHEKEENKEGRNNVRFAKQFLAKMDNRKEYNKFVQPENPKYEIQKELDSLFKKLEADGFVKLKTYPQNQASNFNSFIIHLNDSKTNDYADNNFNGFIYFSKELIPQLYQGFSKDLKHIQSEKWSKTLNSIFDRINKIPGVKRLEFFYDNTPASYQKGIDFKIFTNFGEFDSSEKYYKELDEYDNKFIQMGFEVSNSRILYRMKDPDLIFITQKSRTLGSKHPNYKIGEYEFFSTNKPFDVYDYNFKKIASMQLDERGCNLFYSLHPPTKENKLIIEWMLSEFKNMKYSNPKYGTYEWAKKGSAGHTGHEGKSTLNSHDLILWFNQHKLQHENSN